MNEKTTAPKPKKKQPRALAGIPEFVPEVKIASIKIKPPKKRHPEISLPLLPFAVIKSRPKKAPKKHIDLRWLGNPFVLQDGWAWKSIAVISALVIALIAAFVERGYWPSWKHREPKVTEPTTTEATTLPRIPILDFNFKNAKSVLAPQEEHRINVAFEPGNVELDADDLTWRSDKPEIVEVNGIGVLTAHVPGTATICAIYKEVEKTISVTVREPVELSEIYFSEKARSVPISGTLTLDVLFDPKDATNRDFKVESNNPLAIEAKRDGNRVVISVLKNDGQTHHALIKIYSVEDAAAKDSIEVFTVATKGESVDGEKANS